jgi:twitching motility protein PilT
VDLSTKQYSHILTVEDPIEFVHESKKSLINQREVGRRPTAFPMRCARHCVKTRT